jgi:hypothetical protein
MVRLVAAANRVDDIVGAREPLRSDYVEEWADLDGLRPELSSERFGRLLDLVEMAAEAPEIEFRSVTATHGIDFVATQRAQQELDDVETGGRERVRDAHQGAWCERPEGGSR